MKIILISTPQLITEKHFEDINVPTVSIYALASAVKHMENIVVKVIDPCEFKKFDDDKNLKEKCVYYLNEYISREKPDLIGFSVNTFNWGITKYIINSITIDDVKTKIVVGGLHATTFDEYVLKSTKTDFVIRGEGEKTLREMCRCLIEDRDIKKILGITYREGQQIVRNQDIDVLTPKELELLEIPAFDLMPEENPYVQIPVESSRGCQFSCIFCSIPHRKNWRALNEEKVSEKVEKILAMCKDKIKGNDIIFVDDCFSILPERALHILELLVSKYGNSISFFIEVRISNIISNKLLEKLPDGCNIRMQIGVECGYDEGLQKIRKGINLNQLHKGLEIVTNYEYSDKCFLSFIIGFPWETEKEINLTLDTIEYITRRYEIMCNINWLFLLPSDLWRERGKYGINLDESVFDQIGWMGNEELFFKVHPLVSLDTVKKISDRIDQMQGEQLRIRYNKPFL